MSSEPAVKARAQDDPARKPRIALMGEFSAGKSTLANLMLGEAVSPVKATATQLPPVWYSFGAPGLMRIDLSGAEEPLDPGMLDQVSPHDTKAVRVFMQAEVLEFCDLVDMPGTSDPNMPPEIWQEMLARADGVVWCTPANQAWRQSEAAMWEEMPDNLHQRSLLLITRLDKLLSERDRARVVGRVRREVDGQFRAVLPISLTEAAAAGDDAEVLKRSGAEGFADSLIELVEDLQRAVASEVDRPAAARSPLDRLAGSPDREADRTPETVCRERADAPSPSAAPPSGHAPDTATSAALPEPADPGPTAARDPDAIVPRRVVRDRSTRTERPQAQSAQHPF